MLSEVLQRIFWLREKVTRFRASWNVLYLNVRKAPSTQLSPFNRHLILHPFLLLFQRNWHRKSQYFGELNLPPPSPNSCFVQASAKMTAPSPALSLLTLCCNVPLGVYFPFCFIIHFPILLPIWGKSSCLHICPERQSAFMYRNQELAMCQQGWVTAWCSQIRLSVHCCPQMLLEKWVPVFWGAYMKTLAKAAVT